jgi:hypothetical protein
MSFKNVQIPCYSVHLLKDGTYKWMQPWKSQGEIQICVKNFIKESELVNDKSNWWKAYNS